MSKEYCIFRIEDNKLILKDLTSIKAKKIKQELNDTYGFLYDIGITKNYESITVITK